MSSLVSLVLTVNRKLDVDKTLLSGNATTLHLVVLISIDIWCQSPMMSSKKV